VVAIDVASEQVERAVVLVGRTRQDLLDRGDLLGLHARAARQRRMERGHPPVIAAAWRLVGARHRRTDHHGVGAAGDRLGDVAPGAHAPVGDHMTVATGLVQVLAARGGRVCDRRRLRDTDTEHAACRAGVAGADPDQHTDRTCAHQVQRRGVGGAPAHDHRDVERRDELLQVERLGLR
jgi:hypothetical protein